VKGFDRKLTAMLLPVHLWQSAVAAFNKCQLLGKFTSPEQLKQAAAQWICLFQEALLKTARKLPIRLLRVTAKQVATTHLVS
jgi:hypothetical protein